MSDISETTSIVLNMNGLYKLRFSLTDSTCHFTTCPQSLFHNLSRLHQGEAEPLCIPLCRGVFLRWLWGQDNPLTYNPLLSEETARKEGFRAKSAALWNECTCESACDFHPQPARARGRERQIPPVLFICWSRQKGLWHLYPDTL